MWTGPIFIAQYQNWTLASSFDCSPASYFCYSERKEFLLLAQKERIVRFDLATLELEVLPIKGLKNVIAVEFDIHNNCVYWADMITDTIAVSFRST